MEKDIDRIPKNQDTEIVIRIDDFGGKAGLTIREFVRSERYTGFTKAGTRIPAEHFKAFKQAINSIDEEEIVAAVEIAAPAKAQAQAQSQETKAQPQQSDAKQASIQAQASAATKEKTPAKKSGKNYEEMEM